MFHIVGSIVVSLTHTLAPLRRGSWLAQNKRDDGPPEQLVPDTCAALVQLSKGPPVSQFSCSTVANTDSIYQDNLVMQHDQYLHVTGVFFITVKCSTSRLHCEVNETILFVIHTTIFHPSHVVDENLPQCDNLSDIPPLLLT